LQPFEGLLILIEMGRLSFPDSGQVATSVKSGLLQLGVSNGSSSLLVELVSWCPRFLKKHLMAV